VAPQRVGAEKGAGRAGPHRTMGPMMSQLSMAPAHRTTATVTGASRRQATGSVMNRTMMAAAAPECRVLFLTSPLTR
jgi:hypothetical protein